MFVIMYCYNHASRERWHMLSSGQGCRQAASMAVQYRAELWPISLRGSEVLHLLTVASPGAVQPAAQQCCAP